MKRKNPKFTHEFIDHDGTPRFYLRVPGRKRVPLPGLPWSPEFMQAREKALAGDWNAPPIGANRTKAGTVNAAIISYYQSTAFTEGLAKSTRTSRRAILERFRNEHGDKRIALLHKSALQAILNKRSAVAAKNWKKALRGFLDHCLSLDMIAADPLIGIKLTKTKSKPHRRWTPADIEQYERTFAPGTKARLALELILSTGQARCDVVRMGRQYIRDETLSMSRQKTGVPFDIPVLHSLRAELALQPQNERHLTFLVTEQGKSFTAAGFGNWFATDAGRPAFQAERMACDRRRQRVSPIMALPRISLCRGSAGARSARLNAIPRKLTESASPKRRGGSLQEQELANQKPDLPITTISH